MQCLRSFTSIKKAVVLTTALLSYFNLQMKHILAGLPGSLTVGKEAVEIRQQP